PSNSARFFSAASTLAVISVRNRSSSVRVSLRSRVALATRSSCFFANARHVICVLYSTPANAMNRTLNISWRTTRILPTNCIDRAPQAVISVLMDVVWRIATSSRVIGSFGFECLLALLDALENASRLEQQIAQPLDVGQRVLFLRHQVLVLT